MSGAASDALPYYQRLDHPAGDIRRRAAPATRLRFLSAAAVVLLVVAGSLAFCRHWHPAFPSRGPASGVSEKSTAPLLRSAAPFPWTNEMLSWQRTTFHFQPEKNWMNDPNGPMYYKQWYHLFYQYNPDSALWGNITWGHAVSRDLVRWLHLPVAISGDAWYDAGGVWSGSATFLPDGRPIIIYTGATADGVQVQNLALPAADNNDDDELLLRWVKHARNPVMTPPPGIAATDFRDPTTAWRIAGDKPSWRVAIGSKDDSDHAGIVLVYATEDFVKYELLPGVMHRVAGTGMWECVDFFPVATGEASSPATEGMDTSTPAGSGVKHVVKASFDDDRHDYYAIGRYDAGESRWVPDDPKKDVGSGEMVDWGKFYASKSFYDAEARRRVLWGWVGETDSERADLRKGWASLQAVPRTVVFDDETGTNLKFWPVEEVESLRIAVKEFAGVDVPAGLVVPLDLAAGVDATQLDIQAEFEIDAAAALSDAGDGYDCGADGGAAGRGLAGPFGLLVLADGHLTEQLATYFYLAREPGGALRTFFCQDELRSSKARDILKGVYGSAVKVLDGESLSVRMLVDHSIVESFAQGGRSCITSRVYPTVAIGAAARVFLFNNATGVAVRAKSVKVWEMDSALARPFDT